MAGTCETCTRGMFPVTPLPPLERRPLVRLGAVVPVRHCGRNRRALFPWPLVGHHRRRCGWRLLSARRTRLRARRGRHGLWRLRRKLGGLRSLLGVTSLLGPTYTDVDARVYTHVRPLHMPIFLDPPALLHAAGAAGSTLFSAHATSDAHAAFMSPPARTRCRRITACTRVHAHVHTHVCTHVYINISAHAWVQKCTSARVQQKCPSVCARMNASERASERERALARSLACVRACERACERACRRACVRACVSTASTSANISLSWSSGCSGPSTSITCAYTCLWTRRCARLQIRALQKIGPTITSTSAAESGRFLFLLFAVLPVPGLSAGASLTSSTASSAAASSTNAPSLPCCSPCCG